MGVIAHKTLIVTGDKAYGDFIKAHAKAKELFAVDDEGDKAEMVSDICGPVMNGYATFMVIPDGSKEGWAMSDHFDKCMDQMVAYLKKADCVGEWVLVEYGETGRRVLKSNCVNRY